MDQPRTQVAKSTLLKFVVMCQVHESCIFEAPCNHHTGLKELVKREVVVDKSTYARYQYQLSNVSLIKALRN